MYGIRISLSRISIRRGHPHKVSFIIYLYTEMYTGHDKGVERVLAGSVRVRKKILVPRQTSG